MAPLAMGQVPGFLGGQFSILHFLFILCPQMRCLTMPTLLRALAQAARTGRTKGAFLGGGKALSVLRSQHIITLPLQDIPMAGAFTAAQWQRPTVSNGAASSLAFPDGGPARGQGGHRSGPGIAWALL